MKDKIKGDLMLLTTAIIWGTAFVAQKEGMDMIGPIAFNGIRTVIGGIMLIPVILLMSRRKSAADVDDGLTEQERAAAKNQEKKLLITGSIVCGVALMLAGNIQQIGLFYTTAGKAAFITPLYVVLVPLIGMIFFRKKIRAILWLCVLAAIVGLYLLCIPSEGGLGGINKGDMIMLVCALFFALHILAVDYYSPKVDGVKLSCIQFFVAGIISIILIFPLDPALGFDLPTVENILASWFPLCYVGIMSCGIAYTFQVVGQAYTDPTSASMILSMESVFGVLAGMIFLGEMMEMREILGCIIMFAAIITAQLPSKEERLQAKS